MLVWVGEGWNLLELLVGLWSGLQAGSIALLGFSFDSFLELFAGGVLIWHLGSKWRDDEFEESATERKAVRLVGLTFFVLIAYIAAHSFVTLVGWAPRPSESLVGIVLILASASVMSVLYVWKTRIARTIGSRALRAEATESLVCDIQDLTLFVGLGLNYLAGWWWADPIAALLLIPWLFKEGREAFFGDNDD